MKKLLLAVFLFLFFVFATKISFAQNTNALFQYFAPEVSVSQNVISDNANSTVIVLQPYAKVTIQPNSFSEKNITIRVFSGKLEELRNKFLSKGYSPIASYYLLFTNSKGKEIRPSIPLKVNVINSFTGTTTFYYPLKPTAEIDTQNQKSFNKRPEVAQFDLPVNDYGFIIAINRIIDLNSLALKPLLTPTAKPTVITSNDNSQKIILAILVIIVLAIIGYVYYLLKKPKKIRKVEEPKKIIVGGK